MQTDRENTDCPGSLSEADKQAIKAIPARLFKPKSEAEEKEFRDTEYREHLENYRKATAQNGGVPIRLGIDTP